MKKTINNLKDSYSEVRWQLFRGYWRYALWTVIVSAFVLGTYIGCQF